MLTKEYRICLPMAVDEYRIAQLYMLQKKSREETTGSGSAVEILKNEPYKDGPLGTSGQYTLKVYHIGSHMPGWFRAILPKSALRVEEEAWNAYPFTKTVYKCPFIEKFSLDVETYYFNDCGHRENVFNLSKSELKSRSIDFIDIVKDKYSSSDYNKAEDPKLYKSSKTGRGPLTENWREEHDRLSKEPNTQTKIMCAYKLCKVEFRYWGMQNKIERYIHDIALRKTMLKAHRQAWCWQDEYFGMTIDDIRKVEFETQQALAVKLENLKQQEEDQSEDQESCTGPAQADSSLTIDPNQPKRNSWQGRRSSLMGIGLEELQQDGSEDEFFDAQEDLDEESETFSVASEQVETKVQVEQPKQEITWASQQGTRLSHLLQQARTAPLSQSLPAPTRLRSASPAPSSPTALLVLVFHGGGVVENLRERSMKNADVATLRTTLENVSRAHYPGVVGRISLRLVPCPFISNDAVRVLSRLSPFSHVLPSREAGDELNPVPSDAVDTFFGEFFPLGAVPLYAASSSEYAAHVSATISRANREYRDFLSSPDGRGFTGEVCIIADCNGAVVGYDALCRNNTSSTSDGDDESLSEVENGASATGGRSLLTSSAPSPLASSGDNHSSADGACNDVSVTFDFAVHSFFSFGSPLGLVLAHRLLQGSYKGSAPRPHVQQFYNLYHPIDPSATRLEPLLNEEFSKIPGVTIPRYSRKPLGDGTAVHLAETVEQHLSLLANQSDNSQSTRDLFLQTISNLSTGWWGSRRVDYALFCPEAIQSFPTNALPPLFHASFWESNDAVAFVLRQLMKPEDYDDSWQSETANQQSTPCTGRSVSEESSRSRWTRRRTAFKIKNMTPNHRANDVVVSEGSAQVIHGKFMYGPLDMVALSGETIEVSVERDLGSDQWQSLGTTVTDSAGRLMFTVPDELQLPLGVSTVKLVVSGDGSCTSLSVAVMPPSTECVVFSIDGSFTASVSIMGTDPKVRPGAVDIVRHWQERGYLLLYVTARPAIQQRRVVAWLARHNFPHGLVIFSESLSTDPLKQKTIHLKQTCKQGQLEVHAAYGSAKDIPVYQSIGLKPEGINIIGKVSKKSHAYANILSSGYAAHLQVLSQPGACRPAKGAGRMYVSRGCFSLPASSKRHGSAKISMAHRSYSMPHGNT